MYIAGAIWGWLLAVLLVGFVAFVAVPVAFAWIGPRQGIVLLADHRRRMRKFPQPMEGRRP